MQRQGFSSYGFEFWQSERNKMIQKEIEKKRKKKELTKKRILQNPIFNNFSSEACKKVLIDILKCSGCNMIIENEELNFIFIGYLSILSSIDDLPLHLTNSHTMIFLASHLLAYCKLLAKEDFLISKYSIHHVILPALIVGAKLANDEAIFLSDFIHYAEKLNIRIFNLKTLSALERNYLNKLGYDVKVSTMDACYIYSKVMEAEHKAPHLRWIYFFEAYSCYLEENKSIGVYEELFHIRPKR